MSRVATCQDCGVRFKVPDTVTATRSKCPKCGGVVNIPPAEAGGSAPAAAPKAKPTAPRPAAAPRAPAKAAPAKRAPAAARSAPTRSAPAASKVATAGARSGGAARKGGARGKAGGRSRGGARAKGGRGRGESRDKSSPLLLIVVIVVVLGAGGGAWWYMQKDDAPANTSDNGAVVSEETETTKGDVASANNDEGSASAPAPAAAAPPADGDTPLAAAPAPTTAPTSSAGKSSVPTDERLPTLIQFDPMPPVPGTTQEQVDEWAQLLRDRFLDPSLGKIDMRKLDPKVDALDGVDIIPALFAALDGTDIARNEDVIGIQTLVKFWQKKVGGTPSFGFNGDITARSIVDDNNRVIALSKSLPGWWTGERAAGKDPGLLQQYRDKVASAIADKAAAAND